MSKNRYIPKKTRTLLQQNHFFQCAWCCINLTENHHIEHYSDGGDHSESNLILLCPNCHTEVHKGIISKTELRDRKSTHLKNDRITGNFLTHHDALKFRVGSNIINGASKILVYKNELIMGAHIENKNLLINLKFYDQCGNLIFWMSKNRYWTVANKFTVYCGQDFLDVYEGNSESNLLKIKKQQNFLNIEGSFYLGGRKIVLSPQITQIGGDFVSGCEFNSEIVYKID